MKYLRAFPFTQLCLVAIFVLCLFPIPPTPFDDVTLIDKWTHMAMYAGFTGIFWTEYWFRGQYKYPLSKRQLHLVGVVIPIIIGGLIEILQATCTGGSRCGEWLDWVADTIGVFVGLLLGNLLIRKLAGKFYAKKNRTGH